MLPKPLQANGKHWFLGTESDAMESSLTVLPRPLSRDITGFLVCPPVDFILFICLGQWPLILDFLQEDQGSML